MTRPIGSKNRDKVEFQKRMEELNCDVIQINAQIAMRQLPCHVCEGVPNQNENKKGDPCKLCHGTGFEYIEPSVAQKSAQTLLDRLAPKLASKQVQKTSRKTVVVALNHASQQIKDDVQGVIDGEAKEVSDGND